MFSWQKKMTCQKQLKHDVMNAIMEVYIKDCGDKEQEMKSPLKAGYEHLKTAIIPDVRI